MANVVLSFSRVQTFQRCPWLYHLVFNEGWRAGPKAPAALGQSLHQALAAFLDESNSDHTLERLLEIFDEVWVNEGFANPKETFQMYAEGRKMLENFWALDSNRQTKVMFTEKEFKFDWKGIQVQGTLDRIDEKPGLGYEIVEYKTRGTHWTKERIEKDLQMTFYWWGATEGLGLSPLSLKYYFLSNGESVEAQRDETHLQALKTIAEDVAGKIDRKEFIPDHSYCDRCEMGNRCSKYQGRK